MESIGIYALKRDEITTAIMDGVRAIGYRARHISPKVFTPEDVEPFRAVILGDLSHRQSDIVSAYAKASAVMVLAKRQSIPIMAVIPTAKAPVSGDSWVVFMPTATGLLEDRTTISCSMDAIKKGDPFETILQRFTAHEMGLAIDKPGKVEQPPRGAKTAEADTSEAAMPPDTQALHIENAGKVSLANPSPDCPLEVNNGEVVSLPEPAPVKRKRGRPAGSKNKKKTPTVKRGKK